MTAVPEAAFFGWNEMRDDTELLKMLLLFEDEALEQLELFEGLDLLVLVAVLLLLVLLGDEEQELEDEDGEWEGDWRSPEDDVEEAGDTELEDDELDE